MTIILAIIITALIFALLIGLNIGIVALCYKLIAWAFAITFHWPIAIALGVVLTFIEIVFKKGGK